MEVWKDIKGYEGLYQISNLGNIKSVDRAVKRVSWGKEHIVVFHGKILKPYISDRGYLRLMLSKNGIEKAHKIHKLVAIAFVDNPNGYKEVNHIDGNKLNNHVDNLEWCSRSQNIRHAISLGLQRGNMKMKCEVCK